MTVAPYDSLVYGPLFADRYLVGLFDDSRRIAAMVQVEVALAQVQAELGIIPSDAAAAIETAARGFVPDLEAIGHSTAANGVPVIELVAQLRRAAGEAGGAYVHLGATSQDIIDSAHVLLARDALAHLETRLDTLGDTLAALADQHRDTVMVARTRMQQALPTTFGLKAAGWLMPFVRHRQRLAQLRPRLLEVQFGGAAGTLAALGEHGLSVMGALASRLGLAAPAMAWHSQRDSFAELAGWLALVTGACGKVGTDIVLLAQSEVAEVIEARGGTSSAMPHKVNPINAEMLVTAAAINRSLLTNMQDALVTEHERPVASWQLEWNAMPQMLCCTGAALERASRLLATLYADEARMAANVEAANGLLLAELAQAELSRHMERSRAGALVKEACDEVRKTGRHLMDVLEAGVDADIDWQRTRDPRRYLGQSGALVDRALSAWRKRDPGGGASQA